MHLVIRVSSPPPGKSSWHSKHQSERAEWSSVYELISTWFCSSHTFNKADTLVILYRSSAIVMIGASLRYLGPSLRSSASLVHKAFTLLSGLEDDEPQESTGGIWVYPNYSISELPKPFVQLVPSDKSTSKAPTEGSLFCFEDNTSQRYYAPASRMSQAVVWYLQRR